MRHLTTTEKEELPHRYLSGESSGCLAKSLGVSDVAILNHLKKMGVTRRDASAARRLYSIWDGAFSTLTPESAYWIGFLMADGCICDESKIQVGLAAVDLGHLRKLRRFLRTEKRPIYFVPSTNSYQLKVHSRQLVSDLAMYGVIPRKSLCAEARMGIHMEPAFWLGVMDGDGSLDFPRWHRRQGVRLYGTPALMRQFVAFLVQHKVKGYNSKFAVAIHKRQDSLCEVGLFGQRASNFLALAYAASPVWLDRKWERAEKMLTRVHFSPRAA